MTETPAKRGRPRSFDADKTLARVRDAFWDAGFSATSLDDLATATGLNRPSLYGAFGDKRDLYGRVLEDYRAQARSGMANALRAERPLREGLGLVFELAMALYLPKAKPARGCFMIGTAVTEAVLDEGVRQSLAEGLREIERAFEKRLRLAKERGEIGKDRDPAALAMMSAASLYLISIKARVGEPRRVLEGIAKSAVHLICGTPPKKRAKLRGSSRR